VTVTDRASSIFGASLRIPAGALDEQAIIAIREGNHCCDFGMGPSIKLLPDGLRFKRAATLTIYLDGSEVEIDGFDRKSPAFYQYDECRGRWTRNHTADLKKLGNAVVCELNHL